MKLRIIKILSLIFLVSTIALFGFSINQRMTEKMRINQVYETELVNQMEEALVNIEKYNKTQDLTYYLIFVNYIDSILAIEESDIVVGNKSNLKEIYNNTLAYEKDYPVHDTKLLEEALRLNLEYIKNKVSLDDDFERKVFDAYKKYYNSSEVR